MLGILDCVHWEWRNCPTAWKGMFTGRGKSASMILEAVASYDLWIWHAFFGMPGSNNDINVLERSPLISNIACGKAPDVHFTINGHQYSMGYYLADGIYPSWAMLVQSISEPNTAKKKVCCKRCFGNHAKLQESSGPKELSHKAFCEDARSSTEGCRTVLRRSASSVCHSQRPMSLLE